MSNPEHSNVPSIPDQPVPSTVMRTRESLLADDIVVLSSAGLGVTALTAAGISLAASAGLLQMTPSMNYVFGPLYVVLMATGTIAGYRARVGGLARWLFGFAAASTVVAPLFKHLSIGLPGYQLILGAAMVGGALFWVKKRKRPTDDEERPLLEQGQLEVPKLPRAV